MYLSSATPVDAYNPLEESKKNARVRKKKLKAEARVKRERKRAKKLAKRERLAAMQGLPPPSAARNRPASNDSAGGSRNSRSSRGSHGSHGSGDSGGSHGEPDSRGSHDTRIVLVGSHGSQESHDGGSPPRSPGSAGSAGGFAGPHDDTQEAPHSGSQSSPDSLDSDDDDDGTEESNDEYSEVSSEEGDGAGKEEAKEEAEEPANKCEALLVTLLQHAPTGDEVKGFILGLPIEDKKEFGEESDDDSSDFSDMDSSDDGGDDDFNEFRPLDFPKKGCKAQLLFILTYPVVAPVHLTVPDCNQPKYKRRFKRCITLSLAWMWFYTFLLLWFASSAGAQLGIPDFVMGLTVLAVGLGLPDGISTVIMARNGFGDMALSNTISNCVISLTLGIAGPWVLASFFRGPLAYIEVGRDSGRMAAILLVLAAAIVSTIVALLFRCWRLGKTVGSVIFVFFYLGFLGVAIMLELRVPFLSTFVGKPDNCRANWGLLSMKEQKAWDAGKTAGAWRL